MNGFFILGGLLLIVVAVMFVLAGLIRAYCFIAKKCFGVEISNVIRENVHIDNVLMNSPEAQTVFDYYKKAIKSKLFLDDILKDVSLRREYNNIKKIEKALPKNDDFTYIEALSDSLTYRPSIVYYSVILNPQEKVLFTCLQCEMMTIQKVLSNVTYGGFRLNNGGYRFGNVSYSKKDFEEFKKLDKGQILLTNQRIIFKGENRAKTIPIGDIISIENYEDKGVIVFMKNREKPIVFNLYMNNVFFYDNDDGTRYFFRIVDEFFRTINDIFYKKTVPQDVQEARREADELNSIIAKKAMIAEGLEEEENVA